MRQLQILACVLFVACGSSENDAGGGITTPPPTPLNVSASASPSTTLVATPVKATANPTGGTTPYKYLFTSSTGVVCQTTENTCTATAPSTPGTMTWTIVVTDAVGTHAQTTATAEVTAPSKVDSTHFTMPADPDFVTHLGFGSSSWTPSYLTIAAGMAWAIGDPTPPFTGPQFFAIADKPAFTGTTYSVSIADTITTVDTATVHVSLKVTGSAWSNTDGAVYVQRVENGNVVNAYVIADSLLSGLNGTFKATVLSNKVDTNKVKQPPVAYTLAPGNWLPARPCAGARDTSTATFTVMITHSDPKVKIFAPKTSVITRACP